MQRRALALLLALTLLTAGGLSEVFHSERAARIASAQTFCDADRPAVKTLSDPDATLVDPLPLQERVFSLQSFPATTVYSTTPRIGGIETRLYAVVGSAVRATLEADGDIYVVLVDPGFPGLTMVAEIPDVAACGTAAPPAVATQIQAARANFISVFGLPPSTGFIPLNGIVRMIGAGFFSAITGQSGSAANGLELEPVLDVTLVGPALLPPTFPFGGAPAPLSPAFPVPPASASPQPQVSASPLPSPSPAPFSRTGPFEVPSPAGGSPQPGAGSPGSSAGPTPRPSSVTAGP